MDETNLLSLIRPLLDTNCQITTKLAKCHFANFFLSKQALTEANAMHLPMFPFFATPWLLGSQAMFSLQKVFEKVR
jgi:hypothetical protein